MAEFQEVCKQWTRMCNAVPGKAEHRNLCSNNESGYVCPLRENGLCNLAISAQTNEDWAEGEHIIMSWAADHPEPVYPTWAEWLQEMGVMTDIHDRLNNYKQVMEVCGEPLYSIPTVKVLRPIPADIAKMLGLQPKEG